MSLPRIVWESGCWRVVARLDDHGRIERVVETLRGKDAMGGALWYEPALDDAGSWWNAASVLVEALATAMGDGS